MSHLCSVPDCQSLDESGLNHSAIGSACENDQGFIYKQMCGDIWAESREKTVFGVSDQVRHKPRSTAKVDGYMHAVYFVSVSNNLRFIKFCFDACWSDLLK